MRHIRGTDIAIGTTLMLSLALGLVAAAQPPPAAPPPAAPPPAAPPPAAPPPAAPPPTASPTTAPSAPPTAVPSAVPSSSTADPPPPAPTNSPPPPPPQPVPASPPQQRRPQQRPPRWRPPGTEQDGWGRRGGGGWGQPYAPGYDGWGYELPKPRYLKYREGEPRPKGYTLGSRMRKGYIIAGATTFGATYVLSIAVGAAVQNDADDADAFIPMFVPIAGPFIATGTTDASAFGTFALILDGISQSFGLGMLLFGLIDEEKVWQREDVAILPFASDDTLGLSASGTF